MQHQSGKSISCLRQPLWCYWGLQHRLFHPQSERFIWKLFSRYQTITVTRAFDIEYFFEILQEVFLAVTNMFAKSAVIYKWKDNQFEKFQEIGTEGTGHGSTAFVINSETFIAFANYHNSQQGYAAHSTVFKW